MAGYLKQSTAATVTIGPFLGKTDGVTPETGLSSPTARAYKNGSASDLTPTSWSHDQDGMYLCGLSTTHTNTLGTLRIQVADDSTHLPVWEDFHVVTENVYDTLFSTDNLEVHLVQDSTNYDIIALGMSGGASDVEASWATNSPLYFIREANYRTQTATKAEGYSTFYFRMTKQSDASALTGEAASITCNISQDGGSLTSCTNTPSEVGEGIYAIELTSSEMDATVIALSFTHADAYDTQVVIATQQNTIPVA